MKITIITPTLNSEKFLKETIESIIYQSGNFEVQFLIIDGQSTDKTLSIIDHYRKFIDSELFIPNCKSISIELISEPDNGLYDAIAKGFMLSTGDIIGIINSDDVYYPGAISAVNSVFSKINQVNWITGISNLMNERAENIINITQFHYSRDLIQKGAYGKQLTWIQQESVFFRKELLQYIDISKFRQFKLAGDFFLWNNFAKEEQLYILHSILTGFRKHDKNLSNNLNKYLIEFDSIISKKKSIFDYFKIGFFIFLWHMPYYIKRKLSPSMIKIEEDIV
jgi:glycosyltransferase involved in cell wall biosynthesis